MCWQIYEPLFFAIIKQTQLKEKCFHATVGVVIFINYFAVHTISSATCEGFTSVFFSFFLFLCMSCSNCLGKFALGYCASQLATKDSKLIRIVPSRARTTKMRIFGFETRLMRSFLTSFIIFSYLTVIQSILSTNNMSNKEKSELK